MAIKYSEIKFNEEYIIGEHKTIKAFKTDRLVPSCGYIYKKDSGAVIITADTYSLDTLIEVVDKRGDITAMVIECSFPSYLENLAKESKHLAPKLLFSSLEKLQRSDINHIKPMYLKIITDEIEQYRAEKGPILLKDSDIIEF